MAVFTVGGLLAGIHVFSWIAPDFFFEESRWFYYVFCAVAIAGGAILIVYGVHNIRMDKEFRLTVSEDGIECVSPAKAFGESYSVPLDDIVRLEKEVSESTWCIVTRDNRRIIITPNYGNPVLDIAYTLQELRPEITVKPVQSISRRTRQQHD